MNCLQVLGKDCEFKTVTAAQHRDEFVRDAFINGLSSPQIRQRLLENSSLDLIEAVKQAVSLESAQRHSEQYQSEFQTASVAPRETHHPVPPFPPDNPDTETVPGQVAAVSSRHVRSQPSGPKCIYCGFDRHSRNNCPAREATCNKCHKLGHYSKVCRSRPTQKHVSAILAASYPAAMNNLSKAIISVSINNLPATCLVDTGSSNSFISAKFVSDNNLPIHPQMGHVSMASTCLSTQLEGYVMADLRMGNHFYSKFKLSVLKDLCADVLVGHDLMQQHSKIGMSFGGNRDSLNICNQAAALVEPPRLFQNLSSDCRPTATKSRRFSQEDTEFINSEVTRMLTEGIIVESRSPWRAQVLVCKDERRKKRLVIDYSATINKFTLLDAYPLPNMEDLVNKIASYKVFSSVDLKHAYHQVPIAKEEQCFTAFEACGRLYEFTRIPFGVTNGVACFQRMIDNIIRTENLQGVYAYLDDITICGEDQATHDSNLARFRAITDKYGLRINNNKCKFSQSSLKILGHLIRHRVIQPDPDRLKPLLDLPAPRDSASLKRVMGSFSYYSKWIPRFSDKIRRLTTSKQFPLSPETVHDFNQLKQEIAEAVVTTIRHDLPLVVETDASEYALAATLSQSDRPVAFFSRTLNKSEKAHSAVEKEAAAIMEALRKWRYLLIGKPFKLITDQQALSFIFNRKLVSKIKNEKIMRWRLELAPYDFEIVYRPGKDNINADMFSRACGASPSTNTLYNLHDSLCHPGITRMIHWVRVKNLPYSVDDIKKLTLACPVCAEIKPRFVKFQGQLIKATSPFERLNIDFKGPLPSRTRNRYLLTIVDEFSRFPFAFPCPDISAETVIKCLSQLFAVFGVPQFIHSDRGSSFLSKDLTSFLRGLGVATSLTTPYNPRGNGQVERYNGVIWKAISLAIKSRNLEVYCWENVLNDALHSVRSLLCTATNATPHERLFSFPRRSANGSTLPTWLLQPGPVLIKRNVRNSKFEDLVEEAELLDANPEYALVRKKDGTEATLSLRSLAPRGDLQLIAPNELGPIIQDPTEGTHLATPPETDFSPEPVTLTPTEPTEVQTVQRPQRLRRKPGHLKDFVL